MHGDEINWLHTGRWYRVSQVNYYNGWIQFIMEGERHVFTVWNDVEHPFR